MRHPIFTTLLALALAAASVPAFAGPIEDRVRDRAAGRGLTDEEQTALLARIAEAAAKGLPSEILAEKALEGLAKGVPAARLAAALSELATRLEKADAALDGASLADAGRDARVHSEAVRGAADALRGGASAEQVASIASKGKSEARAAVALHALSGLIAAGVPVDKAHAVVSGALGRNLSNDRLASLDRATVTIASLTGLAPADAAAAAAEGLGRGLSAREIADERRGIQDGLSGRGGVGSTPAGGTNPAAGATAGNAPGGVPGGSSLDVPGAETGFGNVPGGLPTPTPLPTATSQPTSPPISPR